MGKLLIIFALIGGGLYTSGFGEKAYAAWKQYEFEQTQAERQELLRRRDEMFEMNFQGSSTCMQLRKSALLELQCKNEKEMARANFNAKFDARMAEGWRPKAY